MPFPRRQLYREAGNRARTGDLNLGKVALYQLSHARSRQMCPCKPRHPSSADGAARTANLGGVGNDGQAALAGRFRAVSFSTNPRSDAYRKTAATEPMKLAGPLSMLLVALTWSMPLAGQERDGTVALPGQLRLDLSAEYLRVDSRFGNAEDGTWASAGPLDRERLSAVAGPAERFDAFLEATGGLADGPNGSSFNLGTASVDGVVAVRYLPVRLALGLINRLEVGLGIPIVRTQRLVRRLDIEGGNLGRNPSPTENAATLAAMGDVGQQLGLAPLLPLADSPAGLLLQERAMAATGGTLDLPTTSLDANGIREAFDYDRAPYDPGAWEIGDLEVDLRLQLLSSFSGQFPQADSADSRSGDYRLTLIGGYRIAAPFEIETPGVTISPTSGAIGYSGPHAGAIGDLWFGRSWTTIGVRAARLERDAARVTSPMPVELRPGAEIGMDPFLGDELNLWIIPRARLTQEISLGAVVDGRFVSGGGLPGETVPEDRSIIAAGFSLRFSSLPGMSAGESTLPIDASVGYLKPVSGKDGSQRAGRAFLQVTLLPRLWGGSAPVAPPESLPARVPETAPTVTP